MTTILNTEGWLEKQLDGSDDIEFIDNVVLELHNLFSEPLKIPGFVFTEIDLLNEWH